MYKEEGNRIEFGYNLIDKKNKKKTLVNILHTSLFIWSNMFNYYISAFEEKLTSTEITSIRQIIVIIADGRMFEILIFVTIVGNIIRF